MLAVFSACLLVFNVFRLSLSDVLFSIGVPWWLAHSALGGAAWFVVWIWIWQQLSDEYASTRMNSLGTAGSV
jgi:hypothetical protein